MAVANSREEVGHEPEVVRQPPVKLQRRRKKNSHHLFLSKRKQLISLFTTPEVIWLVIPSPIAFMCVTGIHEQQQVGLTDVIWSELLYKVTLTVTSVT